MEEKKKDFKVSEFLNSLAKKGEKYSKLAKSEFNLMVLLEKKKEKFYELGQLVYKLNKKKVKSLLSQKDIKTILTEVEQLGKEEEKLKREIKTIKKSKS